MSATAAIPTQRHTIEKSYWGDVGGKAIWLYKLSLAGGFQVWVTNYGAIIQSLLVPRPNGTTVDVVLGYDTLQEYIDDISYIGCVVGRVANRIETGKVSIEGRTCQLAETAEGFHIHGGHIGFGKKVWDAETFGTTTTVGISLLYTSAHLEEGFPGNLTTRVKYTLHPGNRLSVEYFATTDRATLVNLTQHSYFNLGGHDHGNIGGHLLQTHADWYLPETNKLVPTGEIAPVRGTPFDFREARFIDEQIDADHSQLRASGGYDHFLVLEQKHTKALKPAATLIEPRSRMRMDVDTTEPGFHFYAGNFLAETFEGKNKKRYHHRGGVCLETHHFPDTPNHAHFPSITLSPGEEFNSRTDFSFKEA
ncbi:aldose 1-epimerase [Chryseolinea serpens]|uniref:Aldose 1-epimerase n=1 Tax=Chryseolinea serpens TaxID=947013 RepID=A0A1M5RRX4_9BACT|nr:aldose epimerase family protein [Chryseolinea serpens]SHH28848.1 aldose 1-epimerase [Chryseolinea serpens]